MFCLHSSVEGVLYNLSKKHWFTGAGLKCIFLMKCCVVGLTHYRWSLSCCILCRHALSILLSVQIALEREHSQIVLGPCLPWSLIQSYITEYRVLGIQHVHLRRRQIHSYEWLSCFLCEECFLLGFLPSIIRFPDIVCISPSVHQRAVV